MTMPEQRIAEMIQADIDGELATEDRLELDSVLENSAEARKFHDEMIRLAKLMSDVKDMNPPWGLRRRILDNIKLPAKPVWSRWARPASYGLAIAAGVLMAVGVTHINPQKSADMSNLVGTMVSRGAEFSRPSSSELAIEVQAVTGQVRLKDLGSAWAVEFELNSDSVVEIAIDLSKSGLSFGGYANRDGNSNNENFEVSEGKVRMTNNGSHQFVLFLRRVPEGIEGSQEIGITVSHQGETVYAGLLESRG